MKKNKIRLIEAHKKLEKDFNEAFQGGLADDMSAYLQNVLNYEENDAKTIIVVHKDFLKKFEKRFAK